MGAGFGSSRREWIIYLEMGTVIRKKFYFETP
jgi:hypothetical protein